MGNCFSSEVNLFDAVKKGDLEALRSGLQGDPDAQRDKKGHTLLQKAVKYAKVNCVAELLQRGANIGVKEQTPQGARNLCHMVLSEVQKHRERERDAVLVVRTLLQYAVQNKKLRELDCHDNEATPLLHALLNEQKAFVLEFISAGCNLTAVTTGDKSNSLHLAIQTKDMDIIMRLLQVGESQRMLPQIVNQPTTAGITPLHRAVGEQLTNIVHKLLSYPFIKVDAKDGKGNTPLHIALLSLLITPPNQVMSDLACAFLTQGAAIDLVNLDNQSCLGLAVDLACRLVDENVPVHGSHPFLNALALISQGQGRLARESTESVFNSKGVKGNAPIHVAAMLGDVPMLEGLVRRGADVDMMNEQGQLPLVLAAQYGRKPAVMTLLSQLQADPLAIDQSGGVSLASFLLLRPHRYSNSDVTEFMRAIVRSPAAAGSARLATQPVTPESTPALSGPIPLLHLAAAVGNTSTVKVVIGEGGVSANELGSVNISPLHVSIRAYNALSRGDQRGETQRTLATHVEVIDYLMRENANPVLRDSHGSTPLGLAIDCGHLEPAMAILRNAKTHVDFQAPSGATALYLAIVQNNQPAAQDLVQNLSASLGPKQEFIPLHVAIGCSNPAMVKLLMAHEQARKTINTPDAHKQPAMGYLWETWRADSLKRDHVDHSSRTSSGSNVRASASDAAAVQIEIIKLLLHVRECDPNIQDARGKRLLHWAVEMHRAQLIKVAAATTRLLDPDLPDEEGITPLFRAVQRGDESLVKALIESFPKIKMDTPSRVAGVDGGRTPLHAAIVSGHASLVGALVAHPAIKLDFKVFQLAMQLLDQKASECVAIMNHILNPVYASRSSIDLSGPGAPTFSILNETSGSRQEVPALHYAARRDQDKLIELLVKYGKAPVSQTDSRGLTALHHAVSFEKRAAVRALVSLGANISALGSAPTTPLIAAVAELDLATVEILLTTPVKAAGMANGNAHASKATKDVNVVDGAGHSALTALVQLMLESMDMTSRPSGAASMGLNGGDPFAFSTPPTSGNVSMKAGKKPSLNAQDFGNMSSQNARGLNRMTSSLIQSYKQLRGEPSEQMPGMTPAPPPAVLPARGFNDSFAQSFAFRQSPTGPSSAATFTPPAPPQLPPMSEDILKLLIAHGGDVNIPMPGRAQGVRRLLTGTSFAIGTSFTSQSSSSSSPFASKSIQAASKAAVDGEDVPSDLLTPLLVAIQAHCEPVMNLLLQTPGVDVNGEKCAPAVVIAAQCVLMVLTTMNSAASANDLDRPSNPRSSKGSFLFPGGGKTPDKKMATAMEKAVAAADEAAQQLSWRILNAIASDPRTDVTKIFDFDHIHSECTLLHVLAKLGGRHATELTQNIMSAGKDVNLNAVIPASGRTALHEACAKNDKGMVTIIAASHGVDYNVLDKMGCTALAVALSQGAREAWQALLTEARINGNAKTPLDATLSADPTTTPLAIALSQSNHHILAQYLIDLENANELALPTIVVDDGTGNQQDIQIAGSKFDLAKIFDTPVDKDGRTAVLLAAKLLDKEKKVKHLQALVERGAPLHPVEPAPKPGVADDESMNFTALHFVLRHIALLKDRMKSDKRNASVYKAEQEEVSSIAMAMASHMSAVDAVAVRDMKDLTPLHWAVLSEQTRVVELLVAKAKKMECLDAVDKIMQRTALHYAAQLQQYSSVQALLFAGATRDIPDKTGAQPVHLCERHEAIVKILSDDIPLDALAGYDNAVVKKKKFWNSAVVGFRNQAVTSWKQIQGSDDTIKRKVEIKKGVLKVEDAKAELMGKQAATALYGAFEGFIMAAGSAAKGMSNIGAALGATCELATQILDYMEKIIYNNLVVEHLTGRIRRSVPTLRELRKTLEVKAKTNMPDDVDLALQLVPHIKALGELYVEIHKAVREWAAVGKASLIARTLASRKFYDDFMNWERLMTGCMVELGAAINANNLIKNFEMEEPIDESKLKSNLQEKIKADLQNAMRDIMEAEALNNDVATGAIRLFKDYGLDYTTLKRKERARWKEEKLKDLVIDYSAIHIDRMIGAGGSAQVFACRWQGQEIAYKQFEPEMSSVEALRLAVENEGYIMSTLRHPNIIQMYGIVVDRQSRQYGLVVDYHRNGSLQQLIDRSTSPDDVPILTRVLIALQIASGMAYLHGRSIEPIVHGDLKPSNILLDAKDCPVISDFGLSRVTSNTTTTRATQTRMAQPEAFTSNASAVYTAPEVTDLLLSQKRKNRPVDVFSFGVLLFELLLLRPVYEGFARDAADYTMKVKNMMRPSIPEELPSALADLIRVCWDHEPKNRPDFKYIESVLEAVFESMGDQK